MSETSPASRECDRDPAAMSAADGQPSQPSFGWASSAEGAEGQHVVAFSPRLAFLPSVLEGDRHYRLRKTMHVQLRRQAGGCIVAHHGPLAIRGDAEATAGAALDSFRARFDERYRTVASAASGDPGDDSAGAREQFAQFVAFVVPSTAALRRLEDVAEVEDTAELMAAISERKAPLELLAAAAEELRSRFRDARLRVETGRFEAWPEVYLAVQVKHLTEENRGKLDTFHEEWWYDRAPPASGVTVVLDYV